MRKFVSNNLIEQNYINKIVIKHDNEIKLLQESFSKLEAKQKINTIFYEGQIYDAYSLLMDILNTSKQEIIIIDNYASKELLDILKKIKTTIKIVSSNIDCTLKKKYELQYGNERFYFKISEEDYNFLKSKVLTSKGEPKKEHNIFSE